jgi:hypothetical protein
MALRGGSPATFLLTGFGWLALSSILGLAVLFGLVLGTPLPAWVRLVHVHAALVGGAAQMILGGVLALIPASPTAGSSPQRAHPPAFWALNGGTALLLAGFWLRQNEIISAAGLLVVGASAWIARAAWIAATQSPPSIPNRLFYAGAFLALFGGIACGEALSASLVHEVYGYVRLAHIHLGLLGFVTLVIVGAVHTIIPQVFRLPPSSPLLTQAMLLALPLGMVILIAGFLNSSVSIELAGGGVMLAGGILYATQLFRVWMSSAHDGNAASDHLLIGTFFFLLTLALGLLLAVNNLANPPTMPYGTLHLVAYTHMALLGFVANTAMGVLSYVVPLLLSTARVSSNKKRGPYHERLSTLMDRWRALQVGGLSLGTMALGAIASLTWSVPLTSIYIRVATWACFALLCTSLLLFSAKLVTALGQRPDHTFHETPDPRSRLW